MRKVLLSNLLFLLFFTNAYADQLAVLNLRQAKVATEFLLKQDQLIIFCGCCENSRPDCIDVEDVWYKQFENDTDSYRVYLKGTDQNGTKIQTTLDLAYVFYKKNATARCVGLDLNFKCDPCINGFTWDPNYFYSSHLPTVGEDIKVPFMYSDFVIQNNRKEPFSVYINGTYVGRVSGYGELKARNILAVSPTKIHVIQQSGYLFYPSEYTYNYNTILWNKLYTWRFPQ